MSDQEHYGQSPQKQMKEQAKVLVKAIRKKKKFLRFSSYLAGALVLFHLVLVLVVSLPVTQTLIIERIRTALEKEFGITVDVGYVNFGLLPPRFKLEDVYLMRFSPVSDAQKQTLGEFESFLSLPSMATASLGIERIDLGLNFFAPLDLDIIESVGVSGFRFVASSAFAYEEIMTFLTRDSERNSVSADWWPGYLEVLSLLPSRIELNDLEVEIGQPSSLNYIKTLLEEATFIRNSKNELAVLSRLGESIFVTEDLGTDIKVEEVRTKLLIRPDRGVIIEEILVKSGGSNIETQGSLHITEVEPAKGYLQPDFLATLQLDARIEASLLRIFGLQADGIMRVSGELGTSREAPSLKGQKREKPSLNFDFNGRASWENLFLDGIAVYSGSTDVRIENKELYAPSLVIKTPGGGLVEAEGRLTLGDTFPFHADILIGDLPFIELMSGFEVQTSAMSFQMASGDLRLVGKGRPEDRTKGFELDFAGLVEASRMYVPAVSESPQVEYPLPDCGIDLRLIVDAKGLNFDGSSVNCQDVAAGAMEVPLGRISFSTGQTDFQISSEGFDLSKASYFTVEPMAGIAKIKGRIHTVGMDEQKEVVFDADVNVGNFSYFEIGPVPLQTQLKIDGTGLKLSSSYFDYQPDASTALRVSAPEIFISFGDSLSRFQIQADGDLKSLRSLAPNIKIFEEIEGQIEDVQAEWLMDLGELGFAQPQASGKVRNVKIGPLRGTSLSLDVACSNWLCRRGRVGIDGASLIMSDGHSARPGVATIDFARLSSERLTARARFDGVGGVAGNRGEWEALLSANLLFDGKLDDMRPQGDVSLWDVAQNRQPMGSLELELSKADQNRLRIGFEALFGQLEGVLLLPWSQEGQSTLELTANKMDAMSFRPEARVEYSLFSEITGQLKATSPSFFAPGAFSSRKWNDNVVADLNLERAQISSKGVRASLKQPVHLSLKSSRLAFDDLIVLAEQPSSNTNKKSTSLVGELNYHILDGNGQGSVEGEIDLGILLGILPSVERADGNVSIDTRVSFEDGRPALSGKLLVNGEVLRVKDFEPELVDLQGELIARGDRIEIIRLGAKKGEGSVDVLGSIRLPFRSESDSLELGLRVRLNRLQSRVPAPIFRSVDSVVSGSLELTGEKRPYLLSGVITLDEARAYRDLQCDEIVAALPERQRESINADSSPYLDFDVVFEANDSIQFVTRCVRANLSSRLRMQGTNQSPRFAGFVRAESGVAQVLKAKFEIQKGEIIFDSPIAFDPRLDVQMVSQIDSYQLFMNIDGYSSSPRTSFWSDPSTTPWGSPIGQVEVLRMVSSGRAPQSPTAEGNTLASQVANYVYGTTTLDESLSKAFSKISAGLVDTVRLQPIIENGQTTWKASFSRSVGERFNLGLDVEQSPLVNNQSLTGTLFLNPTVNILGGVDRRSNQSESYTEVSGGFRFTFGGQ